MLRGGRWEGGSCLGTHVRIKDFKNKNKAQGYVPALLENCVVFLALELVGSWVVLGFSVGKEAFDELLSINVTWSQEFSDVLMIWT